MSYEHSPKNSQNGSAMHKRPLSIMLRPLGILYGLIAESATPCSTAPSSPNGAPPTL